MSASGLEVFDKTLQTTHRWLGSVMSELDVERQQAWRALGAVLRALRDRLPVEVAAELGAQLPLLVRGTYYEQWHPAAQPRKARTVQQFLQLVAEALADRPELDAEAATRAVLQALTRHTAPGLADKIYHSMPAAVRPLWPQWAWDAEPQTSQARVAVRAPEIVARCERPLGNVTFTTDGRIILSHHPAFGGDRCVSELVEGGALRAFPDESWNRPPADARDAERHFGGVLGLRGDGEGLIWMLDMGHPRAIAPKLVAWSVDQGRLDRVLPLGAPASHEHSELNDFVIDPLRGMAYLADEGIARGGDGSGAALVVLDLRTGVARRRLEAHVSTAAEAIDTVVDGRQLTRDTRAGSQPFRAGCDGIALDSRSEWLYYGPLSGRHVYRVHAADLADEDLDEEELAQRVETYARRPTCGGMSIDAEDNLYLAEVEHRRIGVIPAADRRYRPYAGDAALYWPDGISTGADGWLYVTASQMPNAPPFNGGEDRAQAPWLLARVPPLARGRLGH